MDGANNDYTIGQNNFVNLELEPGDQTIEFNFRLFGDDIAEGTEAFQATPARLEGTPGFLAPTVLAPDTFIIIEDDDSKSNFCYKVIPFFNMVGGTIYSRQKRFGGTAKRGDRF